MKKTIYIIKIILVAVGGILALLPAASVGAQSIYFSKTLKRGSFGDEVKQLQEFLKTMPDVYPEGLVSGYFGTLTEKAVKRFQGKYEIEQVGIVGPKTRAKLSDLILPQAFRQQLKPSQPSLSSPQPLLQQQKGVQKQQQTISLADQFAILEKELLGVKASSVFLGPAHYERIKQDLAVLENKGYPANEVGRLRDLALKLAPHLQDQKKPQDAPASLSPSGLAAPTPAPPPELKPVLKNLGIRFEPWDKNTNRAGAFIFLPSENKVFLEYGAEVASSEGGTKILPTFEYRTASDADVFAAMDGVVTDVTYQDRNQDYAIHIQPALNSPWILEHDHVSNLKISKGDTVKAGDILGKAGTLGGDLGRTEIMLWSSSAARPTTYCPFKYFDPQLLSEYQQKVLRHMKDWEEFKGNPNLYSEEKHLFPGCVYETLLD